MSDIEYVRIKDPDTGDEFTYDTAKVEALGLDAYVIDKDPFGPDGRPAPSKQNLPKGTPLPGSVQERRRNQATGTGSSGDENGQTSADPRRSN